MISAVQSQNFGFGDQLTVIDLQTIHEYHALHSYYFYTDASTTILGHTHE